jgi:hypothetical protein
MENIDTINGILGAVITILLGVIKVLYKDNKTLVEKLIEQSEYFAEIMKESLLKNKNHDH